MQNLTKLAQRFAGRRHDGDNLQCSDQSVSGRGKIPKDEVAALFASQVQMLLNQSVHDISVAYLRAEHLAAIPVQDLVQAEVAHDRGNERIFLQLISRQQIDRSDGHQLVPIQRESVIVTEQKPISVSVVGKPECSARFLNEARESRRVGASAICD